MSGQRGFTLLEILFTLAIISSILLGTAAFVASTKPFSGRGTYLAFDALLGTARSVAATSGNGATIAVVNDTTGFTVTLYAGRPNSAGLGNVVQSLHEDQTTATSAFTGSTSFAFFLNSAGTGTASAWTVASGTLATEPVCPGALDLTFTAGGHVVSGHLACTDMRLR